MIVNSIMNSDQVTQSQCDNFYLKRKLYEPIENDPFIQPKKRNIQYYSSPLNDNFENLTSNEEQTNNDCELQFNLNNNCNFLNECQTIEYLNYDNTLEPVQTAIYENIEQFDPSQWQNTDLLELDQRYNSVNLTSCFDKRSDDLDNLIQSQQCQSDAQEHMQLQEQLEQQQETRNQQIISSHDQQLQLHEQQIEHTTIINQNNEQSNQRLIVQDNSENCINNLQNESDLDLSWLMNFSFKLDELTGSPENQNLQKKSLNNSDIKQIKLPQSKTGKKVDELIKEVTSDMMSDENDICNENMPMETSVSRTPKKPPFTYTELIEYALEDKRELTVSGIYQWISDRFPFYKSNDDRWKNSVRHNLSINPHFRKGAKASQGAGHLWTIASRDSEENALAWEHKKQRLELFFKMEEIHNQKYKQNSSNESIEVNNQFNYNETELAAATIAQQLLTESDRLPLVQESIFCQTNSPDPKKNLNDINTNDIDSINGIINEDDLKRSAGDILNGIGRTVEVQPIHTISTYHDSIIDNEDYLNPITKEQNLSESGLRNEFYVTEIDPIELGINMSNVEEEVLFNEEFNLNYFGITSGADIVT